MANIPDKTIAEIEEFLSQPDITFKPINGKQSLKTNFLIQSRNFSALAVYSSKLLSFVKYLYKIIDIQNLLASVIEALLSGKIAIQIKYDLLPENSYLLEIQGKTFKVFREDNFKIIITNETATNWNVDSLMIQVKQLDGVFVNPVIKTFESKIELNFADGIATNYNVYLI